MNFVNLSSTLLNAMVIVMTPKFIASYKMVEVLGTPEYIGSVQSKGGLMKTFLSKLTVWTMEGNYKHWVEMSFLSFIRLLLII